MFPPQAGGIVALPRPDGGDGAPLSAQLSFSIRGSAVIKAVQGEPRPALLHTKIRMSTGGNRLRITHRAQRLDSSGRGVGDGARHTTYWVRAAEALP